MNIRPQGQHALDDYIGASFLSASTIFNDVNIKNPRREEW